jgi:hypothetical protein
MTFREIPPGKNIKGYVEVLKGTVTSMLGKPKGEGVDVRIDLDSLLQGIGKPEEIMNLEPMSYWESKTNRSFKAGECFQIKSSGRIYQAT